MKAKTDKQLTMAAAEAHAQRVRDLQGALTILQPSVTAATDVMGRLIAGFMEAQGFWESDNTAEKIALMHSELSEALEADRKDLESDKIPGFSGVEEELADLMIRVFDFAGHHNLRLGEAVVTKMRMNLQRPFRHGKKY
jgi:NTP pyrophosphatase (non-canonical NTP hydrolase)